MKLFDLAYFVFFFVWKQMLLVSLTIFTILIIPYQNVVSINLSVLVWQYVFKLFDGKPDFNEWYSLTWKSILVVTFFYYIIIFLGGFGLIGVLIFLILLAVARIWNNWILFDYATTWGAKRLFKGSKEEFNVEKAFKGGKV